MSELPRDVEELLFPDPVEVDRRRHRLWGFRWRRMRLILLIVPLLSIFAVNLVGSSINGYSMFGAGIGQIVRHFRNPQAPQQVQFQHQQRMAQLRMAEAQRQRAALDEYRLHPGRCFRYWGSITVTAESAVMAGEHLARTGLPLPSPEALRDSSLLMYWPLDSDGKPRAIARTDAHTQIPEKSELVYWTPGNRWGESPTISLLAGPLPPDLGLYHTPITHFAPIRARLVNTGPYQQWSDPVALQWYRWDAIVDPLTQMQFLLDEWHLTFNSTNEWQQATGLALVRESWEPILEHVEAINCYGITGMLAKDFCTLTIDGVEMITPASALSSTRLANSQSAKLSLRLDDPDLIWISRDDIPIIDDVPSP